MSASTSVRRSPTASPALERVPRDAVPEDAIVRRSVGVCAEKRGKNGTRGKKKFRWVCDGSRSPGEPQPAGASSPTCAASTVLLCLALGCVYDWHIVQFDITKAYLLAAPTRTYYVRYLSGVRAYLERKYDGDIPFNPSLYLLRVRKNIYGNEESSAFCTTSSPRSSCATYTCATRWSTAACSSLPSATSPARTSQPARDSRSSSCSTSTTSSCSIATRWSPRSPMRS